MDTIDSISNEQRNTIHDYKYQAELTPKLRDLECDFTQEIINEIVLWKVNRYAKVDEEVLSLLNKIKKSDRNIDIELTKKILKSLLDKKGVRLAMASTILRFKNPFIYQIIDQRAYRFVFGNELNYNERNVNEQIETYLNYLHQLREKCTIYNIPFEDSDEKFYSLDKYHNASSKLKNYGFSNIEKGH